MNIIILTGITRGIGKAVFENISTSYKVIGISRSLVHGSNNRNKIKIKCDLSRLSEVEKLDLSFIELNQEIIFINNAAIIEPIAVNGKIQRKAIERIYRINVISPIILIQKILNITNPNRIKIINITSGAAKKTIPGWSLYSSTKGAMEIYLDALVVEYPNLNYINYEPGVVDTDMQLKIRSKKESDFPFVEKFREFKEKNKLRSTELVAKEIIKLI